MDSQNAKTLADLGHLIAASLKVLDGLTKPSSFDQELNGREVTHSDTPKGINKHTPNGNGEHDDSSSGTLKQIEKSSQLGSEEFPTKEIFDVQRNLLAAAGKLTELVSSPSNRLLEVSSQYFEARALHVVVDKRVADILNAAHGGCMGIETLATRVGIEPGKLSRIMRCLCSIHIFNEPTANSFANNRISAALIHNEPLRAYVMLFALDLYSASDHLPRYLSDESTGKSYDVQKTPFQSAVNTTKPRWEWLEEKVPVKTILDGNCGSYGAFSEYPGPFGDELKQAVDGKSDDELISRPEHKIFGMAMLGGGRVFGTAHLYDFPWADLGNGTIVDVGGGVGGFCLQLSQIYPDLNFVVQDRAPVLEQAKNTIWPRENPEALDRGRVTFTPHNFFESNPVKNADVYWLRYIIHDWSDDYCVEILSAIRESMGSNSRILICDQVMNTTLGSPELEPAPAPLPANWGYYTRYSHQRDLAMMSIINGIERTPSQFVNIIERAGLRLRKIWDCRSQVSIVEVVL
ncbi:O-methyltransferase A [Patellaria atrata CBS 101060]|uniref:O-methyltransferase A n=1 Tax=Patellaria atrata CBS 101060 TaxID=1346257 RepID=A0A9P4VMG5_9PEZI|nr:O-methyltransferase A [Patellaria atrata CBS 101060]